MRYKGSNILRGRKLSWFFPFGKFGGFPGGFMVIFLLRRLGAVRQIFFVGQLLSRICGR